MSEGMIEKILGSISFIDMGQSPDSFFYNEEEIGLPLIQGNADIKERKSIKRIWVSQPTKVCDVGDILMTVRAPVGFIGIASFTSCIGRGVCSIKANGVDDKYLYYLLISQEDNWRVFEQGSTFTAVGSKEVFNFPLIVISSKNEQHRIAQILTTTDAVIEKTQAAIAKYKAIKQGMLHDLFTRGIDPATGKLRSIYQEAPELYKKSKLGWIPREWEVENFENASELITDFTANGSFETLRINVKYYYEPNYARLIRLTDLRVNLKNKGVYVDKEGFEFLSKSSLKENDIMLANVGEYTGFACLMPKVDYPATIAPNMFLIRSNNGFNPIYMYHFMTLDTFTRQVDNVSASSATKLLNKTNFRALYLPQPHSKEQELIGVRLQSIDNKIDSEQTYLQKLHQIKKGLMEDLLSGKKRVIVKEDL